MNEPIKTVTDSEWQYLIDTVYDGPLIRREGKKGILTRLDNLDNEKIWIWRTIVALFVLINPYIAHFIIANWFPK